MSKITAVIDGTTHEVDLSKVTGMDAMQFRMETGQELDLAVLGIIEQGDAVLLADLAVVKWLWLRQSGDLLASFALTAATVTLFPADSPDSGAQGEVAAALREVEQAKADTAEAQTALNDAQVAVSQAKVEVAVAAVEVEQAKRNSQILSGPLPSDDPSLRELRDFARNNDVSLTGCRSKADVREAIADQLGVTFPGG